MTSLIIGKRGFIQIFANPALWALLFAALLCLSLSRPILTYLAQIDHDELQEDPLSPSNRGGGVSKNVRRAADELEIEIDPRIFRASGCVNTYALAHEIKQRGIIIADDSWFGPMAVKVTFGSSTHVLVTETVGKDVWEVGYVYCTAPKDLLDHDWLQYTSKEQIIMILEHNVECDRQEVIELIADWGESRIDHLTKCGRREGVIP